MDGEQNADDDIPAEMCGGLLRRVRQKIAEVFEAAVCLIIFEIHIRINYNLSGR